MQVVRFGTDAAMHYLALHPIVNNSYRETFKRNPSLARYIKYLLNQSIEAKLATRVRVSRSRALET